jgi:2-dehydro-3-deoxyphosphogluconate aldolase / (4S)-4-hydroxy-2-oxoglutarate aldolase
MTKTEARQMIAATGIVPVIRASTAPKALLAVDALRQGGICIVEVTLTVPGAEKVIETLRKDDANGLLVGAGTVTDVEGAKRCLDAGAQFIVSPGWDAATVDLAKSRNVLMIAGALTPTEILHAWKGGADLIKIFPCSSVGGASYIKSLRGPFPDIPFIPTGGVNLQTAASFIHAGAEALGVGGELVPSSALDANNPGVISRLAEQFLKIVREARGMNKAAAVVEKG